MDIEYTNDSGTSLDEFTAARSFFDDFVGQLQSPPPQQRHDEIEGFIHQKGQELCRLLYQGALDQRSNNEERKRQVVGEDNVVRGRFRKQCQRTLTSVFGDVTYRRHGYSAAHSDSRFPLDGALNMPKRQYTYGLRESVSLAVCQSAFDSSLEALSTLLAGKIPKRQAEELVSESSIDFHAFYARQAITPVRSAAHILVMSQDGKGINLIHDDLREATRKAAQSEKRKLSTRLSSGEKRNRKRMATVATVYDIAPYNREAADVISNARDEAGNRQCQEPTAQNKRVWASIEQDMGSVTEAIIQEALRRDPNRQRPWVMLVDGHKDQIRVIQRLFRCYEIDAPLVLDFIHVLEYLWKAAWCFFDNKDDNQAKEAEKWVLEKAEAILKGRSDRVAAGLRIKAKRQKLSDKGMETIDKVAKYLNNHRQMLRYDHFMAQGFPIASGVIEGACRHLIADRFEITGARWSLKTAEGILRLRAIRASGDWESYHAFHKKQEWQRNHVQRFADVDRAAMVWSE